MVKEREILLISFGLLVLSFIFELFEPGCTLDKHGLISLLFMMGAFGMISTALVKLVFWVKEKITGSPEE